MKEAKVYHVGEDGLVEGKAIGRISVYTSTDYELLQKENERLHTLLKSPAPTPQIEPIGEIYDMDGIHMAIWANGTPDVGTKLYASPQPPVQELAVHIKCETTDENVIGTTSLNVVRIEHNDDGSITAVTDHWPASTTAPQPSDDVAKDAARYRWLRDEAQWLDDVPQAIKHRKDGHAQDIMSEEELDAAIDAAMAGGGV